MDELVLSLHDVSFSYDSNNPHSVLENVNLKFKKGKITSILGRSGCGKTTMFDLIIEYRKPISGYIKYYQGLTKNDVGIVLQKNMLFPWMTVYDNLDFCLKKKKLSREERKDMICNALNKCGLDNVLEKYPAELSGGMYARLSFIRTMILRPEIVLLDEAFNGIDVKNKNLVLQYLRDEIESNKITVLNITHDIGEIMYLSDELVVFREDGVEMIDNVSHLNIDEICARI